MPARARPVGRAGPAPAPVRRASSRPGVARSGPVRRVRPFAPVSVSVSVAVSLSSVSVSVSIAVTVSVTVAVGVAEFVAVAHWMLKSDRSEF